MGLCFCIRYMAAFRDEIQWFEEALKPRDGSPDSRYQVRLVTPTPYSCFCLVWLSTNQTAQPGARTGSRILCDYFSPPLKSKKGVITFTYLVMVEQLFVPQPQTNLFSRLPVFLLLYKCCRSKCVFPSFCPQFAQSYRLSSLAVQPFAVVPLSESALFRGECLWGLFSEAMAKMYMWVYVAKTPV